MENEIERRKHVTKQLEKMQMPYEVFSAIEGKKLGSEKICSIQTPTVKHVSGFCGKLTPGELGCLLSHKKILEENFDENYIFILEDDVDLDMAVKDFLVQVELQKPKFDVCMVGFHSGRGRQSEIRHRGKIHLGSHVIGRPVERCFGTYGYIISSNGMRTVLENLDVICAPIDHYIGCLYSLNLYVTKKVYVKINPTLDLGSSIQKERILKQQEVSYKNIKYYKRFKVYGILRNLVINSKNLFLKFM